MSRKIILVWVLFLGIALISGCQTAKGFARGMTDSVRTVTKGIAGTASGVAKDSVGLWQAILKFDNWIKDNLW